MTRLILVLVVIVIVRGGVFGQTVGPTPTDYPTGWASHTPDPSGTVVWTASPTPYIIPTATPTIPIRLNFDPFAPIPTPTIRPTWTPRPGIVEVEMPIVVIYQALQTAAASVNEIPDRIGVSAFDGRQLFSYAKWAFSARAADEVFGPFGILISHLQFVLTITVLIAGIAIAIRVIRFVVSMILFAINTVRKLLPI